MKRTKLLLLMALLVIPFLGARATYDATTKVMTYTITWDGGQIAGSYNGNWNGEKAQWEEATSVTITCDANCNLNNADIQILRNLIISHNLKTVNLAGATFKNDVTTGDVDFNYPDNDGHNLATKGVAVKGYASYKCPWTGNDYNYGYCIAGEIGPAMFADCTKLVSITLPRTVTKVGVGAFFNCTSLQAVYIPAATTTLDWECFYGCSSLKYLFPMDGSNLSNVTTVNAEAFKGCSDANLDTYFKNLTGVHTIGYSAFENTQISLATAQQIINQFEHGNVSSSDRGYYRIPEFAFKNCTNISGTLDLSNTNIYGIDTQAFSGCTGLTGITLGANIDGTNSVTDAKVASKNGYLGDRAFAGCKNLGTVTVNAGTAPTCGTNVFGSDDNTPANAGPEPNDCEVVFATTGADAYDATGATGYMTYRVHQNDNDFKYLLTKTMNEDNIDYTVVPQRHADVILHRTFKEGWNTLALPFGSASYEKTPKSADADCAEIFQNALQGKGTSGASDFMIAAYRGLNTTTNTFYFLKYANVETDPLDEFEPLLIKMGAGDITSDNKYTFSNVEVNYDADHNTEYTAAAVKPLIGTLAGTASGKVDGNYNHDLNAKFKNCTYDKFYFTGTLCKNSVVASATSGFIQTGDYIIQDNNFYQVAGGNTYGLKGFRGWFKQLPTAGGAKPSVTSIDVVSGDEPTDIVKIDANGEEVSNGKVYNVNGQLVGTSLNGLSKGLYIVNGKKYVVK